MNIVLLVALALLFVVERGSSPPVVSLRFPETAQLVAGEFVEVQISVTLTEGYHLQANPASEAYLVPTRLELEGSADVTVSKITYPPGKPYRLNGADKDLQTYDGNFEIGVLLKASSVARSGKRILQGRLHYQACDSKTCLPPTSVPLTMRVRVNPTQQKTRQAKGAQRSIWSFPAKPSLARTNSKRSKSTLLGLSLAMPLKRTKACLRIALPS